MSKTVVSLQPLKSTRPTETEASQAERELSSVGSERLPYKQRVGGSNPSAPTSEKKIKASDSSGAFLFSRKNTICCIYVGVVVVTRGKGKNENRFCLHEVVLQKSLQDRSIKTDTEADSHHGDAQIY